MNSFDPPPFDPHPFFRGGHLQTLASIRLPSDDHLPTVRHEVAVSDGDTIMLHDNRPAKWGLSGPVMLLIHGLTGCHAAPYMIRLAQRFNHQGIRVFRMDMRGCGAGIHTASQFTHAGRSDDIIAALEAIARLTSNGAGGRIGAIGISLSGNQLLRAVGRIGAGLDTRPSWFDRLWRIAAVSPPLDLVRCSENMNRISRRLYNRYFIHWLLKRVPGQVRLRADFQRAMSGSKPKTLWQLDDRFTAPLSGFRDAREYYQQCSAIAVTKHNQVDTLILMAKDDPLVPIHSFSDANTLWPDTTRLVVTETGGHVGFIDRCGESWMDEALSAWFT